MYRGDGTQHIGEEGVESEAPADVCEAIGDLGRGGVDVFEDTNKLVPVDRSGHEEGVILAHLFVTHEGVDGLLRGIEIDDLRRDVCGLLLEIDYDFPKEVLEAIQSLSKETLYELLRHTNALVLHGIHHRLAKLLGVQKGRSPQTSEYLYMMTILKWLNINRQGLRVTINKRSDAKSKIFILSSLRNSGVI
jgi:hypothetical protein